MKTFRVEHEHILGPSVSYVDAEDLADCQQKCDKAGTRVTAIVETCPTCIGVGYVTAPGESAPPHRGLGGG